MDEIDKQTPGRYKDEYSLCDNCCIVYEGLVCPKCHIGREINLDLAMEELYGRVFKED